MQPIAKKIKMLFYLEAVYKMRCEGPTWVLERVNVCKYTPSDHLDPGDLITFQ